MQPKDCRLDHHHYLGKYLSFLQAVVVNGRRLPSPNVMPQLRSTLLARTPLVIRVKGDLRHRRGPTARTPTARDIPMSLQRVSPREYLLAASALPRRPVVQLRMPLQVMIAREARRTSRAAEGALGEVRPLVGAKAEEAGEYFRAAVDVAGVDGGADVGGAGLWLRPVGEGGGGVGLRL